MAAAAVARYVRESQEGEKPVGSPPPLTELIRELRLRELIRGERLDVERFEPWLEEVLAHSVRLHHPHQIAHQVSAPDVPSAIADLIQGAINQPMSIYEMGPAAHAMERVVVEWMSEKVGWGAGAGRRAHSRRLAREPHGAPGRARRGGAGRLGRRGRRHARRAGAARQPLLGQAERGHARPGRAGRRGPGGGRVRADRSRGARATRSSAATPRVAGRWPSWRRPAPRAPGSTTTWSRSARSAASTASGSTWTRRTARRRCSRPSTGTCCKGIELADSTIWDAHKMMRTPALAAGGAPSRRAPARGGLPPEGRLPDLRGFRAGVAEPARAPGRVHQGRSRHADLHEPRLPRRGGHRALRGGAVRQDGALLGADRGAPGLRVPQPAGGEHPLLPSRQRPRRGRCGCASGCSPSEAST